MTKDSKLIASGTYGCVVIPPITKSITELKKYTNKSKDDIGKLFKATSDSKSKKEALKEYSKYKESVENVLYYTKIVPKIKGYNIINNITDTQIYNCLFLDDYDEDIHQLIYENAGITFKDYPYNRLTYKKLMKMLKTFLKYFNYYVESGRIHNDINNSNIMIKNNRILLIDFGLEKTKDLIFTKKYNSFFKHKYVFYPPEYRLLYLKKKINTKENVNFGFNNFKYLIDSDFNIMSKEYILKEIGSLLDNFSTNYKKIDIFAIGVNLYLLRNRIIFDSNDELKSFNYLIKKMIEPHHIKRFSILEVIKYAS
jgi:hypothetical protein